MQMLPILSQRATIREREPAHETNALSRRLFQMLIVELEIPLPLSVMRQDTSRRFAGQEFPGAVAHISSMNFFRASFASAIAVTLGCRAAIAPAPFVTSPSITPADARARMSIVADDSMKGREAGGIGNFKMTTYLAHEVARMGLEPGGENGTWFQVIPMVRRYADSASTFSTAAKSFALFTDFVPVRPTPTLRTGYSLHGVELPVTYAGRAGDSSTVLAQSDVAGHVLIFDAALTANGKPTGTYSTPMAISASRFPSAAAVAVAALDLVTPGSAASLRSRGVGLSATDPLAAKRPMAILVTSAVAESIMGAPLASLQPGAHGASVRANLSFVERPAEAPARNVIAILRGSDTALRNEYVAIGAHSDHLGMLAHPIDNDSVKAFNRIMRPQGAQSPSSQPSAAQWATINSIRDSLRKIRPSRLDSVYNGADDDGSGSVALLEIAEAFASGKRPGRSIIMVWHTGEEAGLLGSAWFTAHPTVPHDSIVAQLNMDMVGRGAATDLPTGGPRNLQVIGSRRLSTELGDIVDSVNIHRSTPYQIDYTFDAPGNVMNRYCRSDHYMYARSGIPIAFISRGYHQDYHQVTDEAQYIDYDGLANVARFVHDVAVALADRNDRVRIDKPKPDPFGACRQ
jgi:peptidase M28-like protein